MTADLSRQTREARDIAEEIVRERGPDRVMEVQRARMWDRNPSEWTRYERHLAEEFVALAARVDALQEALRTIQQWDCLNPPDPALCGDHPWLKRHVDAVLASAVPAEGENA